MASNLNKAFMRAYAKDRKQSPPDLPATTSAEIPAQDRLAPTAINATATYGGQPAGAQAQPSRQSPPPPKVISARYVQTVPPANSATAPNSRPPVSSPPISKSTEAANVADAASVWQRIDEAHVLQSPHAVAPPSRPVGIGVGSTIGPRQMQAGAAAPPTPAHRSMPTGQPQELQLPLLINSDQVSSAPDAQTVETRRRTVADFLYSAGQVQASSATTKNSIASQPSASQPLASTAVRSVVANRSSSPALEVGSARTAGPTVAHVPAGRTRSAGGQAIETSSARAATTSTAQPQARSQRAAAVAMPMPPVAPMRQPAVEPAPSSRQPAQHSRTGQILRVDVPRGARSPSDASSSVAAVAKLPAEQPALERAAQTARQLDAQPKLEPFAQPIDEGSEQRRGQAVEPSFEAIAETSEQDLEKAKMASDRLAIEQRRIDRAHELDVTEQQLRRYKHKIFNPVWEVDTLQWPGVCDKLMAQRAESMAQVAAHLKAACDDGLSVLGVTSADSGEGRTTVACCLARLAAAHGLNVILVDLDLDHPTLCLQANLEIEHDWRDCLSGIVKLEEVAVHSIDDQLTLLPLKPRGDRPGLLASDSRIAAILSELSESFELVVVDASRMHSSGNVISGLAHTEIFDASIVVVDRRNSDQERIQDAVLAVQQTGIESIGIVDNFSM